MIKFLFIAVLGLSSTAVAAQESNPVLDFLRAADTGDTSTVGAMIDSDRGISAERFMKKLEGCYLRRVYRDPGGGILAAWMCSEGDKKSRVMLTEVVASGERVALQIRLEQTNQRPAPPRKGSALAEEEADG